MAFTRLRNFFHNKIDSIRNHKSHNLNQAMVGGGSDKKEAAPDDFFGEEYMGGKTNDNVVPFQQPGQAAGLGFSSKDSPVHTTDTLNAAPQKTPSLKRLVSHMGSWGKKSKQAAQEVLSEEEQEKFLKFQDDEFKREVETPEMQKFLKVKEKSSSYNDELSEGELEEFAGLAELLDKKEEVLEEPITDLDAIMEGELSKEKRVEPILAEAMGTLDAIIHGEGELEKPKNALSALSSYHVTTTQPSVKKDHRPFTKPDQNLLNELDTELDAIIDDLAKLGDDVGIPEDGREQKATGIKASADKTQSNGR